MTGLIYKDFLALKGHLTTYLVFFLVYGGLCLSGVFTASVLCGMVVLMSLITPMTTVTSPGPTPSTCSGTLCAGTSPGQASSSGSRCWPPGAGALTR